MADPTGPDAESAEQVSADQHLKDEILVSMLGNVVFDGWTERSLRDGATMAGHDAAAALHAFPAGIPDVIVHFGGWTDRRMTAALEAMGEGFAGLPVRDRVARALHARFAALEPHKEAVRRLLVVLALPQNVALGTRQLYRAADAVWHAAGDDSTDFSFYTRRASMAGVLSAATFYWLADRSEDHAGTRAFIDRQIQKALSVGRTAGWAGSIAGGLTEAPWRLAATLRDWTVGRRAG